MNWTMYHKHHRLLIKLLDLSNSASDMKAAHYWWEHYIRLSGLIRGIENAIK